MIKVALVGSVGAGKSYISSLFGYPIFNADIEVSKIYQKDRSCYLKLKKTFPREEFSFPIKKEELTKCILSNDNNLKKISKIVHPIVRRKLNFFLKSNHKKKCVILDIPLYLENKLNVKGDIIVFIKSKKTEIEKRLKKRRSFNSKLLKLFRNYQLPSNEKKKRSKFIINNNFTKRNVIKEISRVKSEIGI
ncbi:dephospho-CoA kinase [Candidatus Pelagibacter sp.]|uniref:dephospho-CoA kinase n=1 Tax=Candidatus Pelagibacter sp. TaxID=2024849 RepID=UPI003F86C269